MSIGRRLPCRCLGFPAALVIFVTESVYLAAQNPGIPLAAVTLAGLVNVAGDFVTVQMLGLGIAGAAWATVAAQVTGRIPHRPSCAALLRNLKLIRKPLHSVGTLTSPAVHRVASDVDLMALA